MLGGAALGAALRLPVASSLALGACLAFPPWVRTTLQNGQPEQALLGVAAAVVAVAAWAARGEARRLALVPLATFAAGIACPHLTLAALAVAAVFAMFALARRQWRCGAVLFLLAAGGAGVAAYHGSGFDPAVPHFFAPFGLLDSSAGPAAKTHLLLSDLFGRAGLPPGRAPWVIHLGYVGVPLAVAGILGALRRGGEPEDERVRVARTALAAALLCLALGLGFGGWAGVGPMSSVLGPGGTPYRFVLGAVMALSVAASTTRLGPWVAAASLVEALSVDPRPLPFPLVSVRADASAAALGGGEGGVLDLPTAVRCHRAGEHYLLEAARHGRPTPLVLRSGPGAYPVDTDRYLAITAALEAPDCAERIAPLLDGYSAVVAHRHADCLLRETQLACLRAVLGPGTGVGEVTWWDALRATPAGGAPGGPP